MIINEAYRDYLRECQTGILTEIVLGSSQPSAINQRGISRIHLGGELFLTPSCSDRVSAYLRLDPYSGRLLIHFLTCSISDAVREKHFAEDRFMVEDGYPLGGQMARELRLVGDDHWINAGNYPLLDDGELLTVSVRVRQLVELPATLPAHSIAA